MPTILPAFLAAGSCAPGVRRPGRAVNVGGDWGTRMRVRMGAGEVVVVFEAEGMCWCMVR